MADPIQSNASIPLTTKSRRRRRRTHKTFKQIIASLALHALAYVLIFTAVWRCPNNPDSSILCPAINSVLPPALPIYSEKVGIYVSPFITQVNSTYFRFGQPVVTKVTTLAKSLYEGHVEPTVLQVEDVALEKYDIYLKSYVDKIIAIQEDIYETKMLPTHVKLILETTKNHSLKALSGTKKAAKRLEVVGVYVLQVYHDHIEPAVLKVNAKILSHISTLAKESKDESDECDCTDEDCDCDDDEYEDVDEQVLTSTITRIVSRTEVQLTSRKAVDPLATPEITPPAEPFDHELAYHKALVEQDIMVWNSEFRQAGKSAITSLTAELESLFQSAKPKLESAAKANLTIAQEEVQNVISNSSVTELEEDLSAILVQQADAVRSQAVEAVTAVLHEAESIRTGTLAVFKSIADVGLQELGRKWASMEGITWRDWKEFTALRVMTEEFAQVIVDIPIDEQIVRSVLADVDTEVSKWTKQVQAEFTLIAALEDAKSSLQSGELPQQDASTAIESEVVSSQPKIEPLTTTVAASAEAHDEL
ncbi:hypothetical protein V1512DRAFT_51552 [Lipomyces arxii]|uniref:uncharacterized protein n=1 Tax=Lipomyces arxii TaxID=56418 RepID=UPI0034CDB165